MPTAPVDNNGTELFYWDSGAVPGSSDYSTIVIYHGTGFNGNTFLKLLPLGVSDNVRIVILNRREYAGSSKYTDDDLQELNAGKKSFLERLGKEVAHFLLWFADSQKIPKISSDRKKGGLIVMGWSMGNVTSTAVLGYPEAIGEKSYNRLDQLLRKLIMYDPPSAAFGYDKPAAGYEPLSDPDFTTPQAVAENFSLWVSEYYNHPDLAARATTGLDFSKHGELASIKNMTPEELAANVDGLAAVRTGFPKVHKLQPVLKVQGQNVLFNEQLASEILPKLEFVYVLCTRTVWYGAWAMIETERQYKEHIAQGHKLRPIRFVEIEGANHFAHWDDPKRFWAAIVDAIDN